MGYEIKLPLLHVYVLIRLRLNGQWSLHSVVDTDGLPRVSAW